ncbi:hypothetical protein B0T24DRAFT_638915 [Lasiosphaeria ovina]|uniref:Uncharacterized protein n=1 Tax=Lasiosphaeria ovina TaxID=92902 RepID=A0AAE0JVE1_9PEZI|nr:hypothetical protein B0T24DRAFT_638915 [Lasiosphaeria ovina]
MRSRMLLAACAPVCVAGAFSDLLSSYSAIPAIMLGTKVSALQNGRCTPDTVVQSTNSTFWRKVHDQSMCAPSLTKDHVGVIMVLAAEVLAAGSVAVILPPLTVPYIGASLVFWVGADWFLPKVSPSSSSRTAGADDEVRRRLCHLQGRLFPSNPAMEPPTLFEFLGLDARRKPFWPPNECASPANRYHKDVVKAIQDAALARLEEARSAAGGPGAASWATDERARLVGSVAGILLDDAARYEYMVVFIPVLTGKNLDLEINNVRGRRAALPGICHGLL